MVHSADIGLELKGISEVVAGLTPVNPFVVPEGFFAQFPEKVLTLVRNLEEEMPGEMAPMLSPGLRDRSTLEAPPPGYFEGFAENLMQRLRAEEQESAEEDIPAQLQGLRAAVTLRAPEAYFEGLPERMLALAKSAAPQGVDEELQELSPMLASLPRVYPGTVPVGYFEQFSPATAPVIALETATPKVIPMPTGTRLTVRQFLAAAVTVGVVLTSAVWGYHIYLRPSSNVQNEINLNSPDQLNNALAKISDQAIIDYLKSNTDVSDAEMIASQVDDQQLPSGVDNGKLDDDSKASE